MRFVHACCWCALLIVVSCRENSTGPTVAPPSIPSFTPLEKSVVSSGNAFGFKLLQRVNESEQNANVFISPFSVSMALGMALNGANAGTLDSMKQTLGFSGLSVEEIDQSYRNLSSALLNLDPKVTLSIANSVWSRNDFPIEKKFVDDCKTYFDATAASLDFSSPEALETINSWVSTKTNGKIPSILDRIPPEVVLYLINAVYFKGTWTFQFEPSKTMDASFYAPSGTTTCRLMYQRARFEYRSTDQEQVVDLPYGDGLFSMTIVLPAEGTSIDAYTAGLTDQAWSILLGGMDTSSVDVYLPTFRLEYSRTLNDQLKAMGMEIAFSDVADFSGISYVPLQISEVLHNTFLEVNEEGTEAAAATSVGFRPTAIVTTPVMRIDRPFICAIREHASGTILFVGKIVAPVAP